MKNKTKRYKRFNANLDYKNYDHIIIGSGIGGLTAATWLAKAGKKVLILEQHYLPGGFTHVFKRKGNFKWDVGVHYVGNMAKNSPLKRLFDFISDSKIKWDPIGEVYDVVHLKNKIYQFKKGEEKFKSQLFKYFPNEKQAIIKYLELIKKSNKRANLFFLEKFFEPILNKLIGKVFINRFNKYSNQTTYEVLNNITGNEDLISVLCAQAGNYGLPPKESSFSAHALIVNHFMEGGYYPNGGANQISDKIIETLYKHKAELYINAKVSEIIIKENKVQGVKVQNKFIKCKSVISNVGVNNTFNHLISSKNAKNIEKNIRNLQPSIGHMCLYVGLDKSDRDLKLPKHNIWYFKEKNYDQIFQSKSLEEAAKNFAYISFPSAKDNAWKNSHMNKSTIQLISLAHYKWFKIFKNDKYGKRSPDYYKLKENYKNIMLNNLYQLFPQIQGHVVITEVSTPLSTKHFSNYQSGEIYGVAHTPEKFKSKFLRPKTKIKGLFLTGQDITIVGIAGAMLSGMLTAITILKYRVILIFLKIAKIKP